MPLFLTRFIRLLCGLFLYALGIVLTLEANIGYSPWEVFHVGLSSTTGMSIGMASILTGLVIVAVVFFFKEKVGMGTILNMLLIGIILDIIIAARIIPTQHSMVLGTLMLIAGLFVIALGTYFYMGSAFGSGPRDSLMVVLTRKTSLPVGVCRTIIEAAAVVIGWLLGGMVGVGTIISVVAIGFCVQITFRLLKFDPTKIHHETLEKTFRGFKA